MGNIKKKTDGSKKSKHPDDLRGRAERLLQESAEKLETVPEKDLKGLIHELRVHQVELEIQNEELRRAQIEIEEARNRYFDLYDLAPVGYFSLDRNGLVLQANLTGADLLRRQRGRLKGKLFSRFVLDGDQKIFFSHMRGLLETGAARTGELRLVTRDDTAIYVRMESVPVRSGTGDVIQVRSAVVDVTQEKQAELALRESEERFRLFAETSADIFFQIDLKGRVLYCSPSVERILGYTSAGVKGTAFEEYVSYSDIPKVRRNFQKLIFGEKITPFEINVLGKNGTPVPLEVNASTLIRAGEIVWLLGILRDITERKAIEEELRKSHDQLEQRVLDRTAELIEANDTLSAEVAKRERYEKALKGSTQKILQEVNQRRFLSGRLVETLERDRRDVAMYLHDQIGQMLATLKMDLEMFRKIAESADRPPIEKLRGVDDMIVSILNHVRDISRKLRPDILDTLGFVPALRSLVEHFRHETGLRVHFYYRELSQEIDPDKSLSLYRITQEALNNAAKHAQAKQVFVNLILKNNSLQLSVEDDGIGFNSDGIMKTTTGEGPLGLMIMRERAVLAGGELSVESQIGKGTHVVAEIPIG